MRSDLMEVYDENYWHRKVGFPLHFLIKMHEKSGKFCMFLLKIAEKEGGNRPG